MTTDMKAVWIFSVSVCLFVCLAFDLLCDNVSNDLVIWLRGDLSIVVVIIKNKKKMKFGILKMQCGLSKLVLSAYLL